MRVFLIFLLLIYELAKAGKYVLTARVGKINCSNKLIIK